MTRQARLWLDVTATESSELQTGIQRVTLELFRWLVRLHPDASAVKAVSLRLVDGQWQHWQANAFTHRVLNLEGTATPDQPIEPEPGDCLLHLDLATTPVALAFAQGLYAGYQANGMRVSSIVYDLLPIGLPDCFAPGMQQHHLDWLGALASFDGAICISQAVAQELRDWFNQQAVDVRKLAIDAFRLGSDIGTFGQLAATSHKRQRFRPKRFGVERAKTFLMVGTIEPRKGYAQALDAFEVLWQAGTDYRLIVIGREGWQHLPMAQRIAVDSLACRLQQHPERFQRLLWLDSADDDRLEQAYFQADCLLAASLGEGFGLPIVEATSRGLPVLARDIPVFREVAPSGTSFFTPNTLVDALIKWHPSHRAPQPLKTITWRDSATEVWVWLSRTGFVHEQGSRHAQ